MKTVNFIEAINSGKRFYSEFTSRRYIVRSNQVLDESEGFIISPTVDFINSQFELEEKEITITESQFDEAFKKNTSQHIGGQIVFSANIKKELGF